MILDDYSDFITDYIPYFFLLKLMFFIWLFAPTTRGAMLLYNTIIKKVFVNYSEKIDKAITKFLGESKELADEIKDKATDRQTLTRLLSITNKIADAGKPKADDDTIEDDDTDLFKNVLETKEPHKIPDKKKD
uniref:Receptor expression-enhancing protein n=1 Tax=Euplotes crassus TaxID=5936 RepID=A0A7S3KF14_EUPCR|mmetsp:Transcript_21417/g.21056  ORF Transcript_21417/g.21056 Transcript_21417/m.21056 type:complete len:133 (+) Transcript_21417:299-697(+)